MIKVKALLVYILPSVFMLTLPSITLAQQKEACPARIGVIGNDKLSNDAAEIMVDIYTLLDCPVEIVKLPRRRGFVAFNTGEIDGELFRFPVGANNYNRPYVRSDLPLFEISNSLWAAPGSEISSSHPIGYMIGIVWQQNYLRTNSLPKSGHFDIGDLILHYNNGTIDRFLAEDSMINQAIDDGAFKDGNEPVQLTPLMSGPLYHFLGREFTPFMYRLSDYLREHDPFSDLSSDRRVDTQGN